MHYPLREAGHMTKAVPSEIWYQDKKYIYPAIPAWETDPTTIFYEVTKQNSTTQGLDDGGQEQLAVVII